MSRSPYRYSVAELHQLARTLEDERSPQRQALGRHLRLIADAVAEIAKVDDGRGSRTEEGGRIARALQVPNAGVV